MFPKAILIHRQHCESSCETSCLLLSHSYHRSHAAPLDRAKRRKHNPSRHGSYWLKRNQDTGPRIMGKQKRTHAIQGQQGVPEKRLHDHCKVLPLFVPTAVDQLQGFSLDAVQVVKTEDLLTRLI